MNENWIGRRFDLTNEIDCTACDECARWCNITQKGVIQPVEGEIEVFECIAMPAPSPAEILRGEVNQLKQYLADTDYAVTKCYDRGLRFADEYPDLYQKRQEARDRINEIENS